MTAAQAAFFVFASLWLVAAGLGKRQLFWRSRRSQRPRWPRLPRRP
jgi:hypothetical protein